MSRQASDRLKLPRDIVNVTGAWAKIGDKIGLGLVSDVRGVLRAQPPTVDISAVAAGAELFFSRIIADDDRLPRVASLYAGSSNVSPVSEAAIQAVTAAFQEWRIRPGDHKGSEVSAYTHSRGAGRVLQALAALPNRSYPAFQRPQLPDPRPSGDASTFGALQWPEFEGMDPLAREHAGLSLVTRALSAAFEDLYRTFRFGQAIMATDVPPPDVDAVAWWDVRRCLQGAAASVTAYAAADRASAMLLVGDTDQSLRQSATWVRAGLPRRCVLRAWQREPCATVFSLARIALQCLGSTIESTVAAAGGFAASTGWNKQPVLDLPSRYVAFETEAGSAAVGDTAFVASFKRRAGHHLLVALDRGPARDLILENAMSEWGAAEPNASSAGELLDRKRHGPAFARLERYTEMANASRALDPKCAASDRLFVFPTSRADAADDFVDRRSHRLAMLGGAILSRDGVTFRALRGTWFNVEHADVGSVEATAGRAGQRQSGTAMRNYLRTAVARETWNAHVRFFHDACQSILLDGRPNAIAIIGLDPQDVAWCRRLASASGIALVHSAFGPPEGEQPERATFGFEPTEANLRELYLTHRALRRAALRIPPRTYAERCLPLLGIVKGIRAVACRKHLLSAYIAAARAAHRDLVAGRVALPPVWGA